ncbi:taste receptor type 2 member 8-like [Lithobates pipiens]
MGLVLSGFIVLMNCKTWKRNRYLRTGDKIVTSLCLSRWIFQGLYGIHHIMQWHLPRVFFHGYANEACVLGRIILNYITVWLASLLCVYYCVKITNYKHVVFLYLKAKMSKLVPWYIGLSVFLSVVFSLPYGWLVFFTSDYTGKITESFQNTTKKKREGPYVYFIGSTPPFIIFTVAFFLTVPSLWRHIRNMSSVGSSFRNPDMQAHYNAIKSMAAFFALHILFIMSINITFSGVMEIGIPYNSVSFVLSSFYPFLHSAVIIFYNRKLKEEFLKLFTCYRIFSQEKK